MGRRNGTASTEVRTHNSAAPISGIIDDTAYGQYGIPAYTLNIGPSLSPTCPELYPLWNSQRPALRYALKAAGLAPAATLSRPFGPDVTSLSVDPLAPGTAQVSAVLSASYGTVAGAVYYVDDPGLDGSGTNMQGNFGGGTAVVSATIDTSSLTNGSHLMLVQGASNASRWGVLSSLFFTVNNPPTSTPTFTFVPSLTSTRTASSTPTVINSTRSPTHAGTSTRTATSTPTTIANTPNCNANTIPNRTHAYRNRYFYPYLNPQHHPYAHSHQHSHTYRHQNSH